MLLSSCANKIPLNIIPKLLTLIAINEKWLRRRLLYALSFFPSKPFTPSKNYLTIASGAYWPLRGEGEGGRGKVSQKKI